MLSFWTLMIFTERERETEILREMEKQVKAYMRDNDLETLVVGPVEFTTRTSKRLKITMEDLEDILPEGTNIEDYMQENSSISKKRMREQVPAAQD